MTNTEPRQPEPLTPDPIKTQPSQPEINPAETGNTTEVDLDRDKIETYPNSNPPSEH